MNCQKYLNSILGPAKIVNIYYTWCESMGIDGTVYAHITFNELMDLTTKLNNLGIAYKVLNENMVYIRIEDLINHEKSKLRNDKINSILIE